MKVFQKNPKSFSKPPPPPQKKKKINTDNPEKTGCLPTLVTIKRKVGSVNPDPRHCAKCKWMYKEKGAHPPQHKRVHTGPGPTLSGQSPGPRQRSIGPEDAAAAVRQPGAQQVIPRPPYTVHQASLTGTVQGYGGRSILKKLKQNYQ